MNGAYVGAGVAVLATTTAVSWALMVGPTRTMKRANGLGIVPFELAGTDRCGREILAGWGPDGVAAARRSLHIDFPFLIGYSGLGALLAAASAAPVGDAAWGWLTPVGRAMTFAAILAGLLDVVENIALLRAIAGWQGSAGSLELPMRRARGAAVTKFRLVYLVGGWLGFIVAPLLVLDRLEVL
jgi:hypothetical protein